MRRAFFGVAAGAFLVVALFLLGLVFLRPPETPGQLRWAVVFGAGAAASLLGALACFSRARAPGSEI